MDSTVAKRGWYHRNTRLAPGAKRNWPTAEDEQYAHNLDLVVKSMDVVRCTVSKDKGADRNEAIRAVLEKYRKILIELIRLECVAAVAEIE